MRRVALWRWAVILSLLVVLPAAAQTTAELPPETIARIEAVISTEMSRYSIPGLSVAIVVDNQLVYANGFGFADLESSVPARADTVYRTASIAKPMTATAVMQLAEQGKLDLDAPIQEYCPEFPEKQWPLTARQLLGHLGGIRHYNSSEEATGKEHYWSLVDSLELFKDDPLLHEPGSKFRYTTYGYSVLGCTIEGASGMPYEEYMEKNIFVPAGMHTAHPDNIYVIIPNRARGYQKVTEDVYAQLPESAKRIAEVGRVYNASLHDTSMKVPGGGLVASAIDLARFAIAINTGKLLPKEVVEQMWIRQKTTDGAETRYGLGWFVGEVNGTRLVIHGGGQAGTATFLGLRPDEGRAVAVMCNLQRTPVRLIVRNIRMALAPPPETPAEEQLQRPGPQP